jgi:hypothetical protein
MLGLYSLRRCCAFNITGSAVVLGLLRFALLKFGMSATPALTNVKEEWKDYWKKLNCFCPERLDCSEEAIDEALDYLIAAEPPSRPAQAKPRAR